MSPLQLGPDGERRIDPVLVCCLTAAVVAALAFFAVLFALAEPRPDLSGMFTALAAAIPAIVTAVITVGTRRLVSDHTNTVNQRVREATADAVRAVTETDRIPTERATDHATEAELAAVRPVPVERRRVTPGIGT